jgi:hypothetical protein
MLYTLCLTNMRTAQLIFVTVAVVVTTAEAARLANLQRKERRYTAPDGGLSVVIVPVKSIVAGRAGDESRIDFKSSDSKIDCAVDYSSGDNEHGFGVVKAEWTADSQYFVFSLTSSGGHQAWHAPTQFLSRKDGTIHSLDDYFAAAGISKADFQLIAPNTVRTEVWKDKGVRVSVELAALPPLRSWRRSKPFSIACVEGRIFKPDSP